MSDTEEYYALALKKLQQGHAFVSVTLVDAVGSAPQNPGARMLVDAQDRFWGTVGGGKIEARCIREAQQLLAQSEGPSSLFVEWNLQTEIGMSCGGLARFFFEIHRPQAWSIAVFGAGHVAQALVPLLCTLDAQIYCYDTRSQWIDALPLASNLQALSVEHLAEQVRHLPPQSFIVSMTMGHAHDVPILAEVFARQQAEPGAFPFVGVIGSPAKAGAIKRDLTKLGVNKEALDQLSCPIGLPLGSNAPAEIAISIAGQLLQERDKIFQTHQKWQKAAYQKGKRQQG